MGRKGGGRKGFLKGVKPNGQQDDNNANDNVDENEVSGPSPQIKEASQDGHSLHVVPDAPVIKAKAIGEDEDEAGEAPAKKVETRGQMLQRHKRELLVLKKQNAKLGKKKKDEAARNEAEMLKRHQQEIQDFEKNETTAEENPTEEEEADDDPKKPSRAQKRREAKAAKEAEREARIALERANMGETQREIEQKQLEEKLAALSFVVHDIQPDGHCMFRAVEDQLEFQSTSSLGFENKPITFTGLRSMAANHIRKNAEQYMAFIDATSEEDAHIEPEARLEKYCDRLENTAEWGGHLELQAIAEAMDINIEIYSANQQTIKIGNATDGAPVRLSYHHHAYGLGEHYNSVRPEA